MATFWLSNWSSSFPCAAVHRSLSGHFLTIARFSGAGVAEVISFGARRLYAVALVFNALGTLIVRLDGFSCLLYGLKSAARIFCSLPD